MQALVIGLGKSGKAAATLLLKKGFDVVGIDKSLNLSDLQDLCNQGLKACKEDQPLKWTSIDLVVLSPGIPPSHPFYKQAIALKKTVIGEVELAARELKDKQWIGITGTNGKTTTTLFCNHVLNIANKKAIAVGNVGLPLSSEIEKITDEILVAELSSYQLETLNSKVLDIGIILNITPDHLDRYSSMEEYAKAKLLMTNSLKDKAPFYLFEEIVKEYKDLLPKKYRTYGFSPHCNTYTDLEHIFSDGKRVGALPDSLKGCKNHEVENYLATFILCSYMGLSSDQILKGFNTFKKPPHRVEFVRQVSGIAYYDDSKGTNLDAVIKAVDAIPGKIILIAGGVHKGASYKIWKETFKDKVKAICAIGQAAPLIFQDLSQDFKVELCTDLQNAVNKSHALASNGESVLLSPGCSSFDMFKDYAHRGDEFKRVVWEIKE